MHFATLATTTKDLQQILDLQRQNLINHIDESEIKSQGFVTLQHSLKTLEQMNDLAPSVIIKDDSKIVGYALTMLKECRQIIPDLEPMFQLFDSLTWNNRPLNSYSFYVMGQVCIHKDYRGKGLFEQLYLHHKKIYSSKFELFLTEIATRNHRSLRAHEKVGFKTIHTHRDNLDEWAVVGWDWS
ncbi:GNAT family N-acetyltransferase [Terrimonas pollutisoli]|uniref:GNAT family N-acetyltransferase n=1 Tax=Terrimonas pollutisoli TaxID=3034147 RepID=UPI0023EAD791|nr:GNAT family N-acetyltransferase [Terrimonas sp. H1YJ31]